MRHEKNLEKEGSFFRVMRTNWQWDTEHSSSQDTEIPSLSLSLSLYFYKSQHTIPSLYFCFLSTFLSVPAAKATHTNNTLWNGQPLKFQNTKSKSVFVLCFSLTTHARTQGHWSVCLNRIWIWVAPHPLSSNSSPQSYTTINSIPLSFILIPIHFYN